MLHDLNLAAQYADRIVVLKNGRVLTAGAPAAVLTPETIAAAYGVRAVVLPHPDRGREPCPPPRGAALPCRRREPLPR